MKVKRKLKITNIITSIIMVILFITLIISLLHIINWHKDNKEIEEEVEKIETIVEVQEVEDNEKTEIINQPVENLEKTETQEEFNPYWDFIGMSLINVEFSDLKQENSDTVGWIKVNGTTINYPFVQTTDNEYYLNHSFNKRNNGAGWVFLDYRNHINELDRNTIIYAHARLNNTMFGSLRNALKDSWLNDTNNYVVKMSTEAENTLWQVFSVYTIPTTTDYIQVDFSSNEKFLEFENMLKDRSIHNFNAELNENDKILTLSTCYSDTEKLVLHAKLIKREVK